MQAEGQSVYNLSHIVGTFPRVPHGQTDFITHESKTITMAADKETKNSTEEVVAEPTTGDKRKADEAEEVVADEEDASTKK